MIKNADVEKASNTNIVDFLLSIGENIVNISNNYWRLVEHDSLVINNKENYFEWNSRDINGDLIQYLIAVHNKTFREAVFMILNKNISSDINKQKQNNNYPKTFDYKNLKLVDNKQLIINYLCKKRGISEELVEMLINKNYIKSDIHNNVVFMWKYLRKIVGGDKQGTMKLKNSANGRKYFKGIIPTTKKFSNYGFNIKVNGKLPLNLIFFESPIDLLSYLNLHKGKLKDTWLISMSGLKIHTIATAIKIANAQLAQSNQAIKSIKLAVDNDSAGNEFFDKMSNWEVSSNNNIKLSMQDERPTKNKAIDKMDWNDKLREHNINKKEA